MKKSIKKKKLKRSKIVGKEPRQIRFIALYLDPNSKTFSNARGSAIKAGYSVGYANSIMNKGTEWILENTSKDKYTRMITKAEKNIESFLDMEEDVTVTIRNKEGDILEERKVKDSNIMTTKASMTKFVAERIGKFNMKADLNVKHEGLKELNETLTNLMNKKDYGGKNK